MSDKITWGDTVLVSVDATAEFRAGERGSVCGFRDLDPGSENVDGDHQRLYLIEFSDGQATEIPEGFLVKVTENQD